MMSKVGQSILQGATEALSYAQVNKRGFRTHKVKVPKIIDVRAIREKLHMTRNQFADHFGFSIRTLEKWEQGIRQPEGAARAYLVVINHNSKAVESALRRAE
jgi:putative transcriptional regulator